jgi:DNA-binding transcriptional ArsR family regulator
MLYRFLEAVSVMFWQTTDDMINEEVESVRARRVILDQLEGGPKTGSELRDSIRKDMAAQTVRTKGKKKLNPEDFKVTDPKLYFNTKHLEQAGIISSQKVSQQRYFEINPKAIHPVRRVLRISRPIALLTSLSKAEEQRYFVNWIASSKDIQPKLLYLFIDPSELRGASRNLDRYIPDDTKKKWEGVWIDIDPEKSGDTSKAGEGRIDEVYKQIESVMLEIINDNSVIVDLTQGVPTILAALSLIAIDYSLQAIHVYRPRSEGAEVNWIYPRGGIK